MTTVTTMEKIILTREEFEKIIKENSSKGYGTIFKFIEWTRAMSAKYNCNSRSRLSSRKNHK